MTTWYHGVRQLQPWVAYTSGWALYPEAWAWSKVLPDTWVATGRYLHKAIRGVANYHYKAGHTSLQESLHVAEALADQYRITKGDVYLHPTEAVTWHYPPRPSDPGSAADYPKKNDGKSVILPA